MTNPEVTEVEHRLGVQLPGLYRKLLVEVGHGTFGQKEDCAWNTHKEVYHPESVRDLSDTFFENSSDLFAPYFPFGCDHEKQELWIIDAAKECAASIWHETHPDDWSEERWLPYGVWVIPHLDEKAS